MDIEGLFLEASKMAEIRLKNIKEKRDFALQLERRIDEFVKKRKGARIILLHGLRGTGKTIALLQSYKKWKEKSAYFSGDEMLRNEINITEIIKELDILFGYKVGMEKPFIIFLDEISYLKNWELDVKILHDKRPSLMIVATSSSSVSLHLTHLERRGVSIKAYPFTFREYLRIKHGIKIEEKLSNAIFNKVINQKNPTKEFLKVLALMEGKSLLGLYRKYLNEDMPTSLELNSYDYFTSLVNMVKKIIYIDFPKYANLESHLLIKGEQMITYLSRIPSDGVRIEKLSEVLGLSKYSVSKLLELFSRAMVIKGVEAYGRNKAFKFPKKWFFLSPSIRYSLARPLGWEGDIRGNLREDSVLLHLLTRFSDIFYSKEVDFIIPNKLQIEVGGKKRGKKGVLTLVEEEIIKENTIPLPFFLLAF